VSMWLVEPMFFLLLLVFFMSSSILSKYKRSAKKDLMDKVEKGSRRDVVQVIANGLPAWICTGIYMIFIALPSPLDMRAGVVMVFTIFAAIGAPNGDTWSIEIGTLSKESPRWILDLHKPVEKGTSGGVSKKGTLAAVVGAMLIAGLGLLLVLVTNVFGRLGLDASDPRWIVATIIAGFAGFFGSIVDSIFGASIQGFFECVLCNKGTEKKMHCGKPTRLLRGKAWFDNDVVNLVSVSIATLIMLGIASLLFLV
jgi:uncharacterized protein (TIGR00297 family)